MKKFLYISFIFFSIAILAQQKQPKVGLVLSGGGAKGFAHVGILKEIDKVGLQIDYIGGTSIGAFIGGLYAFGYSGEQIEKMIKNTDISTLVRDNLSRSSKTLFEKEYGEKTVFILPVKKGVLKLPKAVSKGQSVLNLLSEVLPGSENVGDFSKLPIPFFCVATNVENGEGVLLENGFLPLALRASGSFPTLLAPTVLEDKLLVDGGLANNFPVSIMKDKGMDIIIGINVQNRLRKKENINSVLNIITQIISYQIYNKSAKEKEKLDIYVHPKVDDYSVVDFDKKNEILQIGIEEGKKYSDVFKEIATKQINKKKRKKLDLTSKNHLISEISLNGIKNYSRAYILGKINIIEGDSISRKELTKRINLLSATNNYERVVYKLIEKKDKTYKLKIFLRESKDNAFLKLGIHYDFLYKSSILANYSHKKFLLKNDLFSLDVILGDNLRYNLNYFVDNGLYISYGYSSRYNHFKTDTKYGLMISEFPTVSSINLNYTDITNQFFIQTNFNRKFAVKLGVEHKFLNINTETILTSNNNKFFFNNTNYFNSFGHIKIDNYDKKYFETKGYYIDLNFKWYMSSSNKKEEFTSFSQANGTIGFATKIFDNLNFKMTNEAGFTISESKSDVFDFYLGGYNQNYINTFVSLYGYNTAELSDNTFIKTEFAFRYNFIKKHYASFIANYARVENNVFKNLKLFDNLKQGYAVGYSYESIIGPLEIKYSWTPDNSKKYWLFNLGFWF